MVYLVRCLDLMMAVPKPRQEEFDSIWLQHEEKRRMATAFMSNLERKWLKEGKKEGVKEGREDGERNATRNAVLEVLDAKFDRAADTVADSIKGLDDLVLLRTLHRGAVTSPTLDDFCKLLPSG